MDQEHPSDYVNDVAQVGGDHYNTEYQHWDWVIDTKLPYLESCATKYLTRWRGKEGIKDLKKSVSYIEKLLVSFNKGKFSFSDVSPAKSDDYFHRFCESNDVTGAEKEVCRILSMTWRKAEDLELCITIVKGIIATAQEAAQVPQRVMGGKGSGTAYHIALQGSEAAQTPKESK